jgi:hypothetical protein
MSSERLCKREELTCPTTAIAKPLCSRCHGFLAVRGRRKSNRLDFRDSHPQSVSTVSSEQGVSLSSLQNDAQPADFVLPLLLLSFILLGDPLKLEIDRIRKIKDFSGHRCLPYRVLQ